LKEELSHCPKRFRWIEKQVAKGVAERKSIAAIVAPLLARTTRDRNDLVRRIERSANEILGAPSEILHPR
jgi:hypothetical protein